MASIHLPIRQLVEFLLRTGSIDSRFAGFDRANEGARIHRKLQKAAGEGYQAEVFLSAEREACGIAFTLEGRADGIFTDENGTVTIDEIKTTTVPYEEITEELNPCHWAQGMVYAAIFSSQQGLEALAVRLTYYQVDTDQIQRFTRQFTQQQLEQFLQQLLAQYAPWAQRQLDWDTRRSQSLAALQFPFAAYRPGQRALAGEVYRACRAGKSTDRKGGTRVFCQAPTGIGKTMSALFPALKAMGEGCGDDPDDWCIGVGDMADYLVETNKGHYVTYDEVMQILQKAEDNGFVHQITNIDGENKIFAICNCNVNVCNALRTSQLFNTPNMSRSAYVARVEPENCVACGRCVEYCPAGAVKLGQKLCTKDGPITYPKQELPDTVKWGPDKWAIDYRDKNRINCYDTGTAPCKTACPAHIAVQGYLKMAAQGRYRDALALIKKENPFPAVCGRICNRRCEDACTRGTVDQAVAIDEVKRFIAQQDLNAETRFVPEKVIPKVDGEFSEKIAVIGGGPAGLSCAYYLAEKGYRPTVFEREARPGGMLMNGIPSFRLEKDVVEAEIDILRELGVEFRCGVEVGKDVTIAQLREQGYQGFYVAVGLQSGGKLNIPGGDADGVMAGIDFMRQVNLHEKKTLSGKVVVIGGGRKDVSAIYNRQE